MRISLFILFFLIDFCLFAQSSNIIQYRVNEPDSDGERSEYLIYNEKEAYYFDDIDGKYPTIEELITNYDIKRGGQKMLRNLNDLQRIKYIGLYIGSPKQILFIDNIPAINWKINKETKVILGYRCQKATGEFRGRKYNVWFTKDIPTSFGPWKWSGLPGLILEVEDLSKSFTFTATKIVKNSEVVIPPQVKTFITKAKEENKLGDLKLYYERLEKILQEVQDRMRAKIPKDAKIVEKAPSVREMWRERTFEWEDPNDPRLK